MEIKYIKDKEVNLDKNDLLGAKPYVDTLHKIISTSDTPFTIGLFGGWGVGKSSIIRTIQEKFNNDNKTKITVFSYDAWKYSNDSFRRTFIYELKKFFNLNTNEDFDSFYNDKHEEIKTKIGISKNWWVYLIVFLISIFLINLTPQIEGKGFEWTTFVISLFISGLITFISKSFVQYKISVTKPKSFAPEQFEEIFFETIAEITKNGNKTKKWISGILGEKNNEIEKLVIVIDNIDRCHKNLAFELLLTIKNFLEQKNVIFIIPIDENEIKKHIKNQGNDPNEFLRKLFNTTISIKKISEGDLFDFAKKLNKDYKLKFPIEVISIISQEFSKNPRKIIQFLNVLQTELVLANFQEDSKTIPKGAITDNLSFLTKLLIIREEWPIIFNKIKDNPYLINNLHSDDGNKKLDTIQLTNEQLRFFKRTEHIKPNHTNFELFFNNKDSFKDIPDITNKLVESNDSEGIKKQIENNELSTEKLIEFIDDKFETALRRGEIKTTAVNILSLLFQMSSDSFFANEIKTYLYGKGKFLGNIKHFINSNSFKSIVLDIKCKLLLTFIKENSSITQPLKKLVVSTINDDDNSKELLINFLHTFKNEPTEFKLISQKFTSLIKEDFSFVDEIDEILSNHKIIENLIDSSLIDSFIEEITNKIDDKDNLSKIKILSIYSATNGLTSKQLELYINKILGFINAVNDYKVFPFWLSKLNPLIETIKDNKLITSIHNSFKTKQDWFWNTYTSAWNQVEYQKSLHTLLESIKELYFVTTNNTQKSQQITWLNNFYSKNESPELIQFINNLFTKIIKFYQVYTWPFAQNIVNRFNQISDWNIKINIASTLNLMLQKTTEEKGLNQTQIEAIFNNYINSIKEENKNEIVKWLSQILKNSTLIEYFEKVVNGMSNDKKLDIIGVLNTLGENEIIEIIINETFEEIDCDELNEIFEKLNEAEISKETIRKSIKTVLRKIEKDDDNFTCFIEFLSENSISDSIIQNLLAEKVKHLIVSDNKEEILFALRIIDKIQIGDSRKSDAIKTLIQDINKEILDEDELKILKRIEKKLK